MYKKGNTLNNPQIALAFVIFPIFSSHQRNCSRHNTVALPALLLLLLLLDWDYLSMKLHARIFFLLLFHTLFIMANYFSTNTAAMLLPDVGD